MKKCKGIVDPITLGFLVSLGIASIGAATDKQAVDQEQLAQEGQTKVELAEPAQQETRYLVGR